MSFLLENRTLGKVLFVHGAQPVVCGTGVPRITALRTNDGADALLLPRFRSRFG